MDFWNDDDSAAKAEAEAKARRSRQQEQNFRVPSNTSNASSLGPSGRYYNPVEGFNKKASSHWGNESARGGTDIFAAPGTAVFSMRGGTVVNASYDKVGGYNVMVRGDDGLLYYYAHMGEDLRVKAGDKVGAGAQIGSVSDTGNAKGTGAHLHLGVGKEIQHGTGPQGGVGTEFDLIAALAGAEDESALRRPKTRKAGEPETDDSESADLDQYDTTTAGFSLPTSMGPTPEQIAEKVRLEKERLAALDAAARRRAMQQDWISQNVGTPYRSPNADIDWFNRG
jgi:murein DD-endopeptidase MepM/ murein hydrolase activator NlpD